MSRKNSWWGGARPDLPWEFGLGWGGAGALVTSSVLSTAHCTVTVGLLVLMLVPATVSWFSGAPCGMLVAVVCELTLIGFVQVGQGRLLFHQSDYGQLLLLLAASVAGASAAHARRSRRARGVLPAVPSPRSGHPAGTFHPSGKRVRPHV